MPAEKSTYAAHGTHAKYTAPNTHAYIIFVLALHTVIPEDETAIFERMTLLQTDITTIYNTGIHQQFTIQAYTDTTKHIDTPMNLRNVGKHRCYITP